MAKVDVSIILINYNTEDYTRKCIESLYLHNKGFYFEIILIDNASDKFDQSEIQTLFPDVIIYRNPVNVGFAKANNLGIENSKGDYILLLNNDTQLIENSIKKCLEFLISNPHIGVVSSKLIYPNGQPQHSVNAYPSITNECYELFRLTRILKPQKRATRYLGRYYNYNESGHVPWVWATFFLFPKSYLSQLPYSKLYDEFFMYYEDIYWCYQFKSAGYSIYYLSKTQVIHHLSQSLATTSANKHALIVDNEWIFVKNIKGKPYAFIYFLIKAFVHLTQRQRHLRKVGTQYLRKAFA